MSEVHWIRDVIKLEVDGDLVLVTPYSAWTYEVTQEYFAVLDVIRARNAHLFLLVDATHGRHVPEERVRRLVAMSTACSLGSCCASLGMMAFALSGWGAVHRSPRHDDAGMREGMLWR